MVASFRLCQPHPTGNRRRLCFSAKTKRYFPLILVIMTTDEEFAFCERTDRLLRVLIGGNLLQAISRLFLLVVVIGTILAFVR